MLKQQEKLIHYVAIAIDTIIVAIAFVLATMHAYDLTRISNLTDLFHSLPLRENIWQLTLVVPIWVSCLSYYNIYQSMRAKGYRSLFWNITNASMLAAIIYSATVMLLSWKIFSLSFTATLFVSAVLLLTLEKCVVLSILRHLRKLGYNYRVLLIVGSGERVVAFLKLIENHLHYGFQVFGIVDEESRVGMQVGQHRVIGSFSDIEGLLDNNIIDEVVFMMPRRWLNSLEDYIGVCEKVGVKATIGVDFFNSSIAKPVVSEMHNWPVISMDTTPNDFVALFYKRVLDIVGSGFGLIVLFPLFVLVAGTIKMTSKGPVFFKQTRCGLRGRKFTLYKFRTMVIDAEDQLNKLSQFNERNGPVFKMSNDPRITPIGRFLRKTSLDELPQLMNVLNGDMSLIGPRPPIPAEVSKYERWQRRRLSMRPGIACIHEVFARNDKSFDLWMKMDLDYIDNWSLMYDFKILIRAIGVVFRGTGV